MQFYSEALEQVLVDIRNRHSRAPGRGDLLEIAGICEIFDHWLPWDLAFAEVLPIDFPEPWVIADLFAVFFGA